MSQPTQLDRAYSFILRYLMEHGYAPFYTELAAHLGITMEEGRQVLHQLLKADIAGWVYPNTNHIASLAPFNSLPTQYRISIDGSQKWFGQ